jgi:hypothetical protein
MRQKPSSSDPFLRKDLNRIHGMDNGVAVDLEDEKFPILSSRQSINGVPEGKIFVEALHETPFLGVLLRTFLHARIQIMDHPVFRYGHLTCTRLTADQDDSIFAEQAVFGWGSQ